MIFGFRRKKHKENLPTSEKILDDERKNKILEKILNSEWKKETHIIPNEITKEIELVDNALKLRIKGNEAVITFQKEEKAVKTPQKEDLNIAIKTVAVKEMEIIGEGHEGYNLVEFIVNNLIEKGLKEEIESKKIPVEIEIKKSTYESGVYIVKISIITKKAEITKKADSDDSDVFLFSGFRKGIQTYSDKIGDCILRLFNILNPLDIYSAEVISENDIDDFLIPTPYYQNEEEKEIGRRDPSKRQEMQKERLIERILKELGLKDR